MTQSGEGNSKWRIGVWPDHGAPISALSLDDLIELGDELFEELARRGKPSNALLDRSDSE